MSSRILVALAALAFAGTTVTRAAAEDPKKGGGGKKPAMELRSSPRFAFSPASVLFTAELKGGDDIEEFYCPEVEWEFGDGGKSTKEADCDPWAEGAKIERRFTANHVFQFAGVYRVKATLRKTGKTIVTQSLTMTIRAGLGDQSPDPGD